VVQTPTKITAILTALPGKADDLHTLLIGMAPLCRAEAGNLRWDVWRDRARGDRYVLDELYRDSDAVEAHHNTPHYKAYLERIPDLAERAAWVLEPVAIG
jgi:quinol monooxygenase YgiN